MFECLRALILKKNLRRKKYENFYETQSINSSILSFFFLTAKPMPDEIMVYHLIHSSKSRGQVGQFTLEEFWHPDCRVRINNTTNGSCFYGTSRTIPKADVLHN